MSGILSLMRDIFGDSRGTWLFSHTHVYTPTGPESSTSQYQLHLPEVCAPAQHFIDMGLGPALARRLSSAYMDSVDRYRKTCQTHFNRATRGGHLTEYYREVFIVLFRRTVQAWDSQIVSIAQVQLCQASVQATVRPKRVDIRVDDTMKADIMARLGLKAPLISDKMVTIPSEDVTSRLKASGQTHAPSIITIDSSQMSSESSLISSTSRPFDPFCQPAPPTCFPAPYPPPPEHSSCRSPDRALATSFVPPAPPRNVRLLTSYSPDVSSLTDLFGRMTVTTLKADPTNPKCHRMFGISEFDKIRPIPSPIAENCSQIPQLASIESIASPPKSIAPVRRRKIAALPTRRGKTSVSPSPPVFDSAGAISYPIPRPYERIVEEATPCHILTSRQETHFVSALPSSYTAEAPCFAKPRSSTPGQRRVHALRNTLPQARPIPQNQTLKPLSTAGETFYKVSRSPPLVSDATSYFDSPPTSSDELDTPPSTPPSSHVLLASTSTESLGISSESDRIVSQDPFGDAKLPYSRQRYRRLDFTKGGLGRDEKPLTFTFSV